MRYALFSFIILASFVPAPTHAGFYGPIISDECKCASVQVEGGESTTPSAPAYGCVLQSLQYVIRIVITIGFVIATLALVYTGFIWMTSAGNPGKVEQGKHLLINTLLGIFIILGAWLLVDFIMKSIYTEGSFGPWNNILAPNGNSASRCLVARQPESLTQGALTLIQGTASGGAGTGTGVSSAGSMTDEQAHTVLQAAGVAIAAPSLANTRNDTINQVVAIKNACGTSCSVQVNSTTSGDHAGGEYSHANGYKVDLQDAADLSTWIQDHLIASGSRSNTDGHGGPRYLDNCNNEYVHEVNLNHWDITVNHGVCTLSR